MRAKTGNIYQSLFSTALLCALLVLASSCKDKDDTAAQSSGGATQPVPSLEAELSPGEPEPQAAEDSGDEEAGADAGAAQGRGRESRDDDSRPWLTSDELETLRTRLGLGQPTALQINEMLTPVDIRELTGYTGTLLDKPLPGQEPNANRNSMRIASDEGFGVGLQVWRVDEVRQLEPRFSRLRSTYIQQERPERIIGQQAFTGEFGGIRHYAFLHRASRQILVVTCSDEICDTPEKVSRLAGRINSRL